MQINNTCSKYLGCELNPENSSSHSLQSEAYTPYRCISQTFAHNLSTSADCVYGGSTIDTVSSCRSDTNYSMRSDTVATRISSFHQSLDRSGWSSNNIESCYKREVTSTVTSNGYLHSSNPKTNNSTNQSKASAEYDRYKSSPSHGSETSMKLYSHSDKSSKTLKSPISRSQSSVSTMDRGRVSNRSIGSSKCIDSGGWSSKYLENNNKRVGTATVVSNGHFHSRNTNSDKSTNQSNARKEYVMYKRLPSHGSETSNKLYSHSDMFRKSPISSSLRSVSPMVRGRKRNLSIESSRGLDSGGRSSKYVERSYQREGTTVMSSEHLHSSHSKCDKSTNQSNTRTEYGRYKRSPSHESKTSMKFYSCSHELRISPISRSISLKDRSRIKTPTLKSPISRSGWSVSPVNHGRKRSPSIKLSRSVLHSRGEKHLRETRRKGLEKRNNKNCERRSTSPKQRSNRTVSPEGRRSKWPMSKSLHSRRSPSTKKQRGNARSNSRTATRSNHSKPRR